MKPFVILPLFVSLFLCCACHAKRTDSATQNDVAASLHERQPTATDVATSSHENRATAPIEKCLKNTDCQADEVCQLKTQTCEKKCTHRAECGEDQMCRSDGRCSPKIFETVWKTTKPSQTITLPWYRQHTSNYRGRLARSFKILWGDEPKGTDIETQPRQEPTPDTFVTHTYQNPGTYHVKILGTYDGWGWDFELCHQKWPEYPLIEIVSFGNVGLAPCAFAHALLEKLPETDIPHAEKLMTTNSFFYLATKFNAPLFWDTSQVTDTSSMFNHSHAFNQPIRIDTSNVTNMSAMFYEARAFDSAVEIDTSKVEDMNGMFGNAKAFNQPVNFNTSNVNDMEFMFGGAKAFNQPVNFGTSNVINMDDMFSDAEAFNQPVNFDTSNVLTMVRMFQNAKKFDQPIHFDFNTKAGLGLCSLFEGAESMNHDIVFTRKHGKNITDTDMSGLLANATSFNKRVVLKMPTYEKELDIDSYLLSQASACLDPLNRDAPTPPEEDPEVIYNKTPHPPRGVCEYCKKYKDCVNCTYDDFSKYERERDKISPDRELVEASPLCQDREGCPCGDGYCGYLGRCIQGLCHCGGFNDQGIYKAVQGNSFKAFTCETWNEYVERQWRDGALVYDTWEHSHRWICDKRMGCNYEGILYPYLTWVGVSPFSSREKIDPEYYAEEEALYGRRLGIHNYEKKYGVRTRILTPKEEERAKELGIEYKADLVYEPSCPINLHAVDGCMRAGLVVTPLNVCQSKRCTCGEGTCTEGFRCVDHQTCRCSNPDGCMCGEQEVHWGTDCKNGVPYCGNLKRTKPYTWCRYRTSITANHYYMPQSAFWDED